MSISYYWQIPPKEPQQFCISGELHRLLFHYFNEWNDNINECDSEFRHWTHSLKDIDIPKLQLFITALCCMESGQEEECKEINKMIDAIRKYGSIELTYGY